MLMSVRRVNTTAAKPAPTQLALLCASVGLDIPWTSMAHHAQVSTCIHSSLSVCTCVKCICASVRWCACVCVMYVAADLWMPVCAVEACTACWYEYWLWTYLFINYCMLPLCRHWRMWEEGAQLQPTVWQCAWFLWVQVQGRLFLTGWWYNMCRYVCMTFCIVWISPCVCVSKCMCRWRAMFLVCMCMMCAVYV